MAGDQQAELPKAPDTGNLFLVGVDGAGHVVVNRPLMGPLTREEAWNLAAWIVALTDPEGKQFRTLVGDIITR